MSLDGGYGAYVCDPGRAYQLLYKSLVETPSNYILEDQPNDKSALQNLKTFLDSGPNAAEAFLQHLHVKINQEPGLEGLAKASRELDFRHRLLQTLGFAASAMIERVAAGSIQQLDEQQLQPLPLSLDFACSTVTDPSSANGSSSMDAKAPGPPSWLHPLLHQLRPEQVVALVSQLLLYFAGLSEGGNRYGSPLLLQYSVIQAARLQDLVYVGAHTTCSYSLAIPAKRLCLYEIGKQHMQ